MPGNYTGANYGWNSDNWPYNQSPFLGRGFYKITVEGKNATLEVDCYGTEWVGGVDVIVKYDYNTDKFKDFYSGDVIDEVNLYDDPSGLQPTPPINFRCTNAYQNGQHPNFSWSKPSAPDIASSNFKYEIYRRVGFSGSFNRIAYNITNTTWTDNEVIIDRDKTNSLFTYYATAYTNQSPISERSDYASVIGNACSKPLPEYSEEDKNEDQLKNNSLFAFPNPFNPSTSIYYSIPTNGKVLISIYNIKGQKIIELINIIKQAGKHSINFNGHSIAGGIYFVRLQFSDQILTKKILLFK